MPLLGYTSPPVGFRLLSLLCDAVVLGARPSVPASFTGLSGPPTSSRLALSLSYRVTLSLTSPPHIPAQAFVRKNCKELVPTADISLPNSLLHIMTSMMDELMDPKQVRNLGWQRAHR